MPQVEKAYLFAKALGADIITGGIIEGGFYMLYANTREIDSYVR